MPFELYEGEQFFEAWKRVPYRFESEEAKARFWSITNKISGEVVLYNVFWRAKRLMDNPDTLDYRKLKARSKYTPDMMRPHCAAWEAGGKMGNYDLDILHKAFRMARDMWTLTEKVTPLDLEDVPFKDDTNFGAPLFASKHENARDIAIRQAKAIRRGAAPEPFAAYWRGKDPEQVRITMAEPKAMFVIGGMFFYPFMEMIKQSDTPYAGGDQRLEISGKVNKMRWDSRFILCLDYSKYDSSIPAKLISMAFSIIESNFIMTQDQKQWWNIYKKHFICGGILMPDGYVYFGRRHGNPSGTVFTSIIGSIVNTIALLYGLLENNISWSSMLVLGDDSAIGLNQPASIEKLGASIRKLGIKVGDDSEMHLSTEDAYFLGHYWTQGVPERPVEESILRLVCPERPKPWMFQPEGSVQFVEGLADRLKDYANDNNRLHALSQKLLDSYLYPSEPWTWGRRCHNTFLYTNQVMDESRRMGKNGLDRVIERDVPRSAQSHRILALY